MGQSENRWNQNRRKKYAMPCQAGGAVDLRPYQADRVGRHHLVWNDSLWWFREFQQVRRDFAPIVLFAYHEGALKTHFSRRTLLGSD